MREWPTQGSEEKSSRQRECQYKSSEAGACLAYLKHSEEASVAGTGGQGDEKRGGHAQPCNQESQIQGSTNQSRDSLN